MNPWRGDEADDQVDPERDGALFTRRVRALPAPRLPSLEAILAEADAPRLARARRAMRVERGRAWAAAFAAAACVAALFTRAPGFEAAGGIVAEQDAGAPTSRAAVRAGSFGAAVTPMVSPAEADGIETCGASSDEANGRSTCAMSAMSAVSAVSAVTSVSASRGEPVAQVLVDEAPGTCSEPADSLPASVGDVTAFRACDRAMSCSAANADP